VLSSCYSVGIAGMRSSHHRLDGDYMLCGIDSRSTCCSSVCKLWHAQDILAVLSVSDLYDLRMDQCTYTAQRHATDNDLGKENMISKLT
jgi:hypothetical protein